MTDLTAARLSAPASISVVASTGDTGSSAPVPVEPRSRHIVGTANPQNTTDTDSHHQPTIRYRTRAGVPPLVLAPPDGQQLQARHVIFDRLRYHVEVPIEFSSTEAVEQFAEHVGDPLIHDHPFWNGRPTRLSNSGSSRLKFRVADGWHIAGDAELRLSPSRKGLLVIDLDLNFSRWAGALIDPDPNALARAPAAELLRKAGSRQEGTLDGNDNVLPNRNRIGSPEAEPRVLLSVELMKVYLDKVDELLHHFLVPCPDYPVVVGMQIVPPRLRGASSAEAYLEFHSDDAIATVERLRVAAIAGMSNPQWRLFNIPSVDGAVARNSPSLTISLTKSIRVAIYAKYLTTIRVEVRYLSDVREQAFHRRERGSARTPTDELTALRPDAARRINDVLSAFGAHLQPDLHRNDGLDLLLAIQAAFGSEVGRARALLSAAVNLGGLTETSEEGIAPPRVVRSLERAGVLQRVHYRHGNADVADGRRFALTPAFASVARSLRSS